EVLVRLREEGVHVDLLVTSFLGDGGGGNAKRGDKCYHEGGQAPACTRCGPWRSQPLDGDVLAHLLPDRCGGMEGWLCSATDERLPKIPRPSPPIQLPRGARRRRL